MSVWSKPYWDAATAKMQQDRVMPDPNEVKIEDAPNSILFDRKCVRCGCAYQDGVERSSVLCVDCAKHRKVCASCSEPFWSKVNNKITCSQVCSRAYELRRSRERWEALKTAAYDGRLGE